ncbi:UNVERIFIED_ORG: adhesin/invasin [Pantoea agglomerans]
MLTSGHVADSARSLAVGEASAGLQQWLNGFGTARIQLNMDRHGSWSRSSGDLLVPLYDNDQSLLFLQSGVRNPSDRLITNLGYGIRTFWQSGWMFGGNVFFDNDFTGHNRRVGIGGEAWRDYLRLSANTYLGFTNWHTSRDFDDTWQEKPADGYDFRAEGWLPSYPLLGGKLEWEQYYGSQVAIFDKSHLQRNPHAISAGIEYTPFPLITLSAGQRQGRGMHDTQVALDVSWGFGHDWRWQLEPANVQTIRTLSGSRYDLVNRNNEIVIQYRKNPELNVAHLRLSRITDNSPADGITRNVLQVLATNRTGQPVRKASVNWLTPVTDGSVSLTAAPETDDNGLATMTMVSTKVQTVLLTAQSGTASVTGNSHFTTVAVSKIKLVVTQDNAPADGNSTDTVVAKLTDSNGSPVTGQTINWVVPDCISMKETISTSDSNGEATIHLMSTKAGSASISAKTGNQTDDSKVHFNGNSATARIRTLLVTTDGSPADGKTENVAQVTVTDANGNPLSGQTITWKADKSTVTFGQSAATDQRGMTTVAYIDTMAESLTLTASLANGSSATASSQFVSDSKSASLKDLLVTTDGSPADGKTENVAQVTVTDANGNPLSGQTITWKADKSTVTFGQSAATDQRGMTTVAYIDTMAESLTLTASLANGSSATASSQFVSDSKSASLKDLLVTTDGSPADGKTENVAQVTVTDANGNPLSGQTITWKADKSTVTFGQSAATDQRGMTTVAYIDTMAESLTLTASLANGSSATASSQFVSDSKSASLKDLLVTTDGSPADGKTENVAQVTVTDANGNPLSGQTITWKADKSTVTFGQSAATDQRGMTTVAYIDTMAESLTLTASLANGSSATASSQFVSDSKSASLKDLLVTTDGSPADGKTENVAQVTVTDANGNPLSGQTITWKADKSTVTFGQSAATDQRGMTTVAYIDTMAESLTLTASLANGSSATASSQFVSDSKSASLKDLLVTTDGSPADGKTENVAQVTVTDANGNPLSGQTITWKADKSTVTFGQSAATDQRGMTTVAYIDTMAESLTLTASLANGSSATASSQFATDLDSAVMTVTSTTDALADGSATDTATVTLKDNRGNALPGQAVILSVSGSAKLSATSGITDNSGQIQVTLTDTTAETVTITAALSNGKTATAQGAFIIYTVTSLTTSSASAKANGSADVTLTAMVSDNNGKFVSNVPVVFSVTGSAILSATTANTNANGQVQVTLTDTTGETVKVTASAKDNANDAGQTRDVTFVAPSITGVSAKGTTHVFSADSGFPETGFAGAEFYMLIDDSTDASTDYTWSSNRPWLTMENNGIAVMSSGNNGSPPASSEREVTITATPKKGGTVLTYTFTLRKWYKISTSVAVHTGGENQVSSACNSYNGTIESAAELTSGAVSVVGKLFGEWRDSASLKSYFYWDAETTTTWRAKEDIAFIYRTGIASSSSSPGSSYVMCLIP